MVGLGAAFVADEYPLELVKVGERALDDPAVAASPELCSVSRRAISVWGAKFSCREPRCLRFAAGTLIFGCNDAGADRVRVFSRKVRSPGGDIVSDPSFGRLRALGCDLQPGRGWSGMPTERDLIEEPGCSSSPCCPLARWILHLLRGRWAVTRMAQLEQTRVTVGMITATCTWRWRSISWGDDW